MNHEQLKTGLSSLVRIFVCVVILSVFAKISLASGNEVPLIIPAKNFSPVFLSPTYEPTFKSKTDVVAIPLKRAGRLFLIEARVDGVDGNLVLDTGAGGLVINSTYFRDHVKSGSTNSNGINGSVDGVSQVTIGKIEFAELLYENLRADLADLGHIENNRNVKILGLIGFSMLKKLEIVIDAKNSELRLYRIDESGKRTGTATQQFQADYSQDFYEKSNIIILKADIGSNTLRFCFDTGAEANVLSSYANKKVLNTLTITRRKVLKGAGTGSSEVLFGRMNEFVLGNKKITGMETIVTNLNALNDAYGTTIHGMLGYPFMENGIICINFVKKQFSIRYWKGGEQ